MKINNHVKFILVLMVFLGPGLRPGLLLAQNRQVPLDLYLIIDASERLREDRSEILNWINTELFNRLLQEGDRLVIWTAGSQARIIHSETISGTVSEAREKLGSFEVSGSRADFPGAVREAASMANRENPDGRRINYTVLISSSAEALAPSFEGNPALFRWFRTEQYSRWQAIVIDPNIAQRVRQAASAYMSSS